MSYGGLTWPSPQFLDLLKGFEAVFHEMHKDDLDYEKNVIDRLRYKITELYPTIPKDLVRTYARGRSFLRMRYIINCISFPPDMIMRS